MKEYLSQLIREMCYDLTKVNLDPRRTKIHFDSNDRIRRYGSARTSSLDTTNTNRWFGMTLVLKPSRTMGETVRTIAHEFQHLDDYYNGCRSGHTGAFFARVYEMEERVKAHSRYNDLCKLLVRKVDQMPL